MTGPKRVLRTFDATSMVTGNMIGSGIFLLAGYAAASVPDSSTLILAWIGGGVMAYLALLPLRNYRHASQKRGVIFFTFIEFMVHSRHFYTVG